MQMLCSAGFIFLIVLWGIVAPDNMASVFDTMLASLTRNFGWFYLWVVLGLVLFAAYVAFSRYGQLRLGGEDDEPEFSMSSWFAMLFAAGMGIEPGGVAVVRCTVVRAQLEPAKTAEAQCHHEHEETGHREHGEPAGLVRSPGLGCIEQHLRSSRCKERQRHQEQHQAC